jgi:predicted anti-sigma-YlaC factor YlaD
MGEDVYKSLLMGYVDRELTEVEVQRIEQHLQECDSCRSELEGFKKLKEVTQNMRVASPDEKYWEQYWSSIYNRLERRIGWILVSAGTILLVAYAIYDVVWYWKIPLVVRIGLMALIIGFFTLLVSVLRERIFLLRGDKYERIKR